MIEGKKLFFFECVWAQCKFYFINLYKLKKTVYDIW